MHMYRFHQAAGGQGTTTCAVGVAMLHAALGKKVLYLTSQRGKLDEIGAGNWEGASPTADHQRTYIPYANGGEITVHTAVIMLSVMDHREGHDIVVVDGCTMTDRYAAEMYKKGEMYEDVWCLMGPGYAEVSKLHRQLTVMRKNADYVLLTRQPERSLGKKDVEAALGETWEVTELPWEPAVFRNLDAGLATRITGTRWGKVLGETFAWQPMIAPGQKSVGGGA